jgi:nucleotide-binding universal stress UspA family protein
MEREIKRILFASDLSKGARHAFDHALSLAIRHGAPILILHVVETLAPGTEERVAESFGRDLYAELKSRKNRTARDILIDKKVDAVRARDTLTRICQEANPSGPYQSAVVEDILIAEGHVVDEILLTARQKACDLIVMGMRRRGRLANAFTGSTIRNVLRQTDKPVLVVPPTPATSKG